MDIYGENKLSWILNYYLSSDKWAELATEMGKQVLGWSVAAIYSKHIINLTQRSIIHTYQPTNINLPAMIIDFA